MMISFYLVTPKLFAEVKFTEKLEEVRIKAADEGKLFFIHFTATWCMPCQWMEENTFKDKQLGDYANTYYLAVKVDIDERDGTFYKEHYKVTILPSLLIFSPQGVLLKRLEETLAPEKLLQILKNYNNPENRRINKKEQASFILESPTPRVHVSRPALIPETKPATFASTTLILPERVPINGSIPLPPIPSASNTFEEMPLSKNNFSIQVGVYMDYSNALRQLRKLQGRLVEKVKIQETNVNNRTKYKILIGLFSSKEKAIFYLDFLKSNNIWGFVKKVK